MGPPSISSRRGGYGIALVIAVAGLSLLYFLHLFYLQLILVVGGAAVMVGIVIWERRGAGNEESGPGEAGLSKARLIRELDLISQQLQASRDEQERGYLRARKVQLEQEVRRLDWSRKGAGLESRHIQRGSPCLTA